MRYLTSGILASGILADRVGRQLVLDAELADEGDEVDRPCGKCIGIRQWEPSTPARGGRVSNVRKGRRPDAATMFATAAPILVSNAPPGFESDSMLN